MFDNTKILLIGGGKMGEAMLAGWLGGEFNTANITVVEPDAARAADLNKKYGIRVAADAKSVQFGFNPAIIVLAVKPQVMGEVLASYREEKWEKSAFLSIAAGKTIASIEGAVGAESPVIRAMPNLPATIGKGITVAVANKNIDDFQKAVADALLQAVGDVHWLEDETLLDAVTAVSGSGPAYVFYFLEAMMSAAEKAGLPADLAHDLAIKTFAGSVKMAADAKIGIEELRKAVTSPGGTTEAGLAVLMADDGLLQLLIKTVAEAKNRSEELNS